MVGKCEDKNVSQILKSTPKKQIQQVINFTEIYEHAQMLGMQL